MWQRIKRGAYSERTAARLVREVLRAVAQCHAKGVIVRDVKVRRGAGRFRRADIYNLLPRLFFSERQALGAVRAGHARRTRCSRARGAAVDGGGCRAGQGLL